MNRDNSTFQPPTVHLTDFDSGPSWHKAVGITLALSSSLFIGISFILKKKGLINSNSLPSVASHSRTHDIVVASSSDGLTVLAHVSTTLPPEKPTSTHTDTIDVDKTTALYDRCSIISTSSTITSFTPEESEKAFSSTRNGSAKRALESHPYLKEPLWWIGLITS